jgi:hypothetical protein
MRSASLRDSLCDSLCDSLGGSPRDRRRPPQRREQNVIDLTSN